MEKAAQRKYLFTLGVMVAIMFMGVYTLKFHLKNLLVASYSAIKVSDDDGEFSKPDPNHLTWSERAKKYWENY